MRHITEAEFTAAVEAAVQERGADYVYPEADPDFISKEGVCVYRTPSGEPACIVGLALHNLGIEAPGYEDRSINARELMTYMEGVRFPKKVITAAAVAQDCQDAEKTWGEAMNAYLKHLSEGGD